MLILNGHCQRCKQRINHRFTGGEGRTLPIHKCTEKQYAENGDEVEVNLADQLLLQDRIDRNLDRGFVLMVRDLKHLRCFVAAGVFGLNVDRALGRFLVHRGEVR